MAEKFRVKTSDGEVFRGWYWEAEEAHANLNIITGMDEYAFRYDAFARWMNTNGVNVWVLDALGQGLNAASPEEQEIWPKDAFRKHVEAIHRMNVHSRKNGLPTVQMGHSMGSFMTQALIERYPCGTDKVILCGSNGGQAGLMRIASGLSKILVSDKNRDLPCDTLQNLGLGAYAKAIPDRRTDLDWLSYNEDNVRQYLADPWCGHPNTGGFWKEFLAGMAKIWTHRSLKNLSPDEKILLIAGEEDPVGQMGKGVRWLQDTYQKYGVTDVRMNLYEHMRHEILNETGKEKVWQDVLDFILE